VIKDLAYATLVSHLGGRLVFPIVLKIGPELPDLRRREESHLVWGHQERTVIRLAVVERKEFPKLSRNLASKGPLELVDIRARGRL
jgi:hypothetical protein